MEINENKKQSIIDVYGEDSELLSHPELYSDQEEQTVITLESILELYGEDSDMAEFAKQSVSDLPSDLLAAGQFELFEALVNDGFDCESAKRPWRTWDEDGSLILKGGDGYNLVAGAWAQLEAGRVSSLVGGPHSIVRAGEFSVIAIMHWSPELYMHKYATAYVGEDGLSANVWYTVNNNGDFVEVDEPEAFGEETSFDPMFDPKQP